MKKRAKSIFKILLYGCVFFAVYYLYKFDYLIFDSIKFDYFYLSLSIILLWLGFFISTLSWHKILSVHNIKISPRLAIYSHGISVFAKYIPGKIWVILGRASIVSEKGQSLTLLSTLSLKEQLIYLFMGLLISSLVLPFLEISPLIITAVILSMVGFGVLLFSQLTHNKLIKLAEKLFKRTVDIPYINFREFYKSYIYIACYWFSWSLGFYFFAKSIYPDTAFLATFFFPVSVSYGLLAIFLPGGIGVRESIIAFLLTKVGLDPTVAISISVIQRLWFILGEIFILSLALFVKERRTK
jgi:glycosyltransferase 2 family protein